MEETAETESKLKFERDLGHVFTTIYHDGVGKQVNEVDDGVTDSAVNYVQIQMNAEDQEAAIKIEHLDNSAGHQHHHLVAAEEEKITLQDELKSTETLDRSSPDLWPKTKNCLSSLSAAQNIIAKNLQKTGESSAEPPSNSGIWAQRLDREDVNLLHQFGSLPSSSLIDEFKKLQNMAHQLELEERREMTRGELLHVLDDD